MSMTKSSQASDILEMQPVPYLDDLQTGDVLETIVYEVTQNRVDIYGVASLDLNPVHMDPDWCARSRIFGTEKPVQHGMMSMSYMTSVVLRTYGPLAEIITIDSKFTKPGPIGTVVTCRGKVRDIHLLGNGNDHAVVQVEAKDQDGDVVGVSDISVRLPRRATI